MPATLLPETPAAQVCAVMAATEASGGGPLDAVRATAEEFLS